MINELPLAESDNFNVATSLPATASDEQGPNYEAIDAEEDATANVTPPTQFKSSLLSFLKQIASATGDLSQLTCPAVMLGGKSLVEYSAYWCYHPQMLAGITWMPDPFGTCRSVV